MKNKESCYKSHYARLLLFALLGISICRGVIGQTYSHNVYADQNGSGYPIRFIYQGQYYHTPIDLSGGCTNTIDRSSPKAVLTAGFCAFKKGDIDALSSVYAPGESVPVINSDSSYWPVGIFLNEQIHYGPYEILVSKIISKNSNSNYNLFPVAIKTINENCYFTNLLDDDPGFGFFKNLFIAGNNLHSVTVDSGKIPSTVVRTNLYPKGSQTQPIVLQYYGKIYNPPLKVAFDIVRGSNEDLSTPEGAVNSAFSACRGAVTNWLVSLVATSEVDSINDTIETPQTIRKYIEQNVENISNVAKNIASATITRKIYYGNYAIIILNNINSRSTTNQDWLVYMNQGKQWLLSDRLNSSGDPVLSFITGFGDSFHFGSFKLYPY